jgi:hypothetical protein
VKKENIAKEIAEKEDEEDEKKNKKRKNQRLDPAIPKEGHFGSKTKRLC